MATKKKQSFSEKIAKAREIFLTTGGTLTMQEIGRRCGLTRQSISKFRKVEHWDRELEIVADAGKAKAVEVAGDSIAHAFDRHLRNLAALDQRIEMILAERKLNPAEVNQLAKAAATIVQTTRLLNNESTSNIAMKGTTSSDQLKDNIPKNDPWTKAMEYIVRTGSIEGQEALTAMIKNQQRIIELGSND